MKGKVLVAVILIVFGLGYFFYSDPLNLTSNTVKVTN